MIKKTFNSFLMVTLIFSISPLTTKAGLGEFNQSIFDLKRNTDLACQLMLMT